MRFYLYPNENGNNTYDCSGLQVYSVGDCYYFQVVFMRTIGYYQPQREFWSNIAFDNIESCCQLKNH